MVLLKYVQSDFSVVTCCVVEEPSSWTLLGTVEELQKLGAKIRVSRNMAYISGKDQGRYISVGAWPTVVCWLNGAWVVVELCLFIHQM